MINYLTQLYYLHCLFFVFVFHCQFIEYIETMRSYKSFLLYLLLLVFATFANEMENVSVDSSIEHDIILSEVTVDNEEAPLSKSGIFHLL